MTPEDILMFWFSNEIKPLWFNSDLIFDAEVGKVFGETYLKAKTGELKSWEENADSILPLIILLDQVPRHMYRDKAEAFQTDSEARRIAKKAIEQGFDKAMGKQERLFIYMPFMHSENLEEQELSLKLYQELGMEEPLKHAKLHHETIVKFGRFPYRNQALGRNSSEEEKQFLAA